MNVNPFSGRNQIRTYSFLIITLLWISYALGQYGEAPNGYYPSAYDGDIFSGKVTAVNETSGQITVSFKEGKKAQIIFVGRLEQPCAVPSQDGKGMTALDLPIGTDVTVFFKKNAKRDANSSTKENLIIGIMFHSWDGHPVRQTAKKMYLCSDAPKSSYLRCFSPASRACVEQIDPITHAH